MEIFSKKIPFYTILLVLICVLIEKSFGQTGITKKDSTTNERNSLLACPKQYLDVLAQCPEALSCKRNEDCPSLKVCCDDACGTRTCVHPWYPKDGDDTLCVNTTCKGQGKQCKGIGNQPACVCIDSCGPPTSNEDFVCASNGMMYFTTCFMDRSACLAGINITATTCTSVPTPNTNILTPAETMHVPDSEVRPPRVESIPDMTTVKGGATVTFRCDVSGNPEPSIFWQVKLEGNLLAPGFSDGRISVSLNSGDITIKRVQRSDRGIYRCHAANRGGAASIKFLLAVRANVPRRGERSSKVDCGTFPSEQARRCSLGGENQRRIKKLWVYNRNKKVCAKSYFRDCRAVTNKFLTWNACASACMDICKFAPKRGTCKRFQQRIFYDSHSGRCLPFVYSGCNGNANNFPNVIACRARCPSPASNPCDNQSLIVLPTTPAPPSCPQCLPPSLVESACQSEFVVIGTTKHFSSHGIRGRSTGKGHSSLHISLTKVMHDRSGNLNLANRNLKISEEAKMEIDLKLDIECPCPDVRKILSKNSRIESINSRRLPDSGRSSDTTVIIMGTTVGGVPTIDSRGFAEKYTDKTHARIISALRYPDVCHLLQMTSRLG